jgi:hypothetical protein
MGIGVEIRELGHRFKPGHSVAHGESRGSTRHRVTREPRWWRLKDFARSVVIMSPLPGLERLFHFSFFPRLSLWARLCRPPRRALEPA